MSESGRVFGLVRSLLAGLVLGFAAMSAMPLNTHAAVGKLKLSKSRQNPEVLVMTWTGVVRFGMADRIRAAFDKHKDSVRVIEFVIDSGGGSAREWKGRATQLASIPSRPQLSEDRRKLAGAGTGMLERHRG